MKRGLLDSNFWRLLIGEPDRPLWSMGGVVLPPVMGTTPVSGDGGTGDGSTGDGSGGAGGGSGSPAGEGSVEPGSSTSETEESVPLSKFKQQEDQLRAADRKRQELENRLKSIEDKDKSELERATGRVQELERTLGELKAELKELRVHNSFLKVADHSWTDPGDALYLAQRKGFLDDAVDDQGQVDDTKVRSGLKKFAEQHKHLLKETKTSTVQPITPKTPVGSGSTNTNSKTDEERIRSTYRSLRH